MTLLTARRIIDVVIVFLIFSYVISWIQELTPAVGSILISLTYLLSYRMARRSITPNFTYYLWMWVPTILFIIAPILWDLMTKQETSFTASMITLLPLFTLIIPIGLLLIVRTILVRYYKTQGT